MIKNVVYGGLMVFNNITKPETEKLMNDFTYNTVQINAKLSCVTGELDPGIVWFTEV